MKNIFVADKAIAEMKYMLTENVIYIEMNTCRFMHKKNSDYLNHLTNSVLSSSPRAIQIYRYIDNIYRYIHTHTQVYAIVVLYLF